LLLLGKLPHEAGSLLCSQRILLRLLLLLLLLLLMMMMMMIPASSICKLAKQLHNLLAIMCCICTVSPLALCSLIQLHCCIILICCCCCCLV
jgi:hypothetical protein